MLFFCYKEREVYVPFFYEMYASIRIECSDDKDIFKYTNNQDLLILTLDEFKNTSIKTNEVFEKEWKYKIILRYNLEDPDAFDKTTEILFKRNSMTI